MQPAEPATESVQPSQTVVRPRSWADVLSSPPSAPSVQTEVLAPPQPQSTSQQISPDNTPHPQNKLHVSRQGKDNKANPISNQQPQPRSQQHRKDNTIPPTTNTNIVHGANATNTSNLANTPTGKKKGKKNNVAPNNSANTTLPPLAYAHVVGSAPNIAPSTSQAPTPPVSAPYATQPMPAPTSSSNTDHSDNPINELHVAGLPRRCIQQKPAKPATELPVGSFAGPETLKPQPNPREFDTNPIFARFFIIKSYSEDDIHKSIKYSIWASTDSGNRRLDKAYRESAIRGPLYLFFSVNASGQFCGMAQMMSPVDYNSRAECWQQEGKWKGVFRVRWIFIKDIPNMQFRHIRLENNENKPVTNSRDTQEVLLEPGRALLKIFLAFKHSCSVLDDFEFYEQRQKDMMKDRQSGSANTTAVPLEATSASPTNTNNDAAQQQKSVPKRGNSGGKH